VKKTEYRDYAQRDFLFKNTIAQLAKWLKQEENLPSKHKALSSNPIAGKLLTAQKLCC
jgi:hypothetical protein